jgi:predicted transcriptional regulator
MTTLKVGIASLDQYKERTMKIVRGEYKVTPDEPKVWFSSIDSFAKVLSVRNRELLRIIAETKPQSLSELAKSTGRAKSNLSRTLKWKGPHAGAAHALVLDLSLRASHTRGRTLVPA